jgi:hypothetical protein
MKSPPRQLPDDEAYDAVEEFIRANARQRVSGQVAAA